MHLILDDYYFTELVNVADDSSTPGPDLPFDDENLKLHRYHCMTSLHDEVEYNSTVMIIG